MATESTLRLRVIQPSAGVFMHGGSLCGHRPLVFSPMAPEKRAKRPRHYPKWSIGGYEAQRRQDQRIATFRERERAWMALGRGSAVRAAARVDEMITGLAAVS